MTCYPELTYSIYADDELPAAEARAVEAHLATCARCRSLVEAYRRENQLLSSALRAEGVEAAAPARLFAARPRDVLWTALAVLFIAAGFQTVVSWAGRFSAPAGGDWLNPFGLAMQMNVFFSTIFYVIQEGAGMILQTLVSIGVLAFAVLAVGASLLLARRRRSAVVVLATLTLAAVVVPPAGAVTVRMAKHSTLVIAPAETLDDTLVFHGETLNVKGTVTGNVIAFAERVEINGTVQGDLVCFTGTLAINGTVEGNVYGFSHSTTLKGRVDKSLHDFTSELHVESPAAVTGDIFAFASNASLDGSTGRDLYAFAGTTQIDGTVGRNVVARTGRLSVGSNAKVGGNITAHVKKAEAVQIDPGATVAGQTKTILPTPRPSRFLQARFYVQMTLGLAVAFLVGLFLYWLFPALFSGRVETGADWLKTAGIGFLALVAPPVAAAIVGVILLGIGILARVLLIATLFPALLFVLWLIAVYVSKLLVALVVGRALLRPAAGQPERFALPLLLGLVIVVVAMHLPYLGPVIHFLVWLVGLGLGVLAVYRHWRPQPATATI